MANLTVEERLKEITEVCEMQRTKLKMCRLILRQHNIGHLYPDATKEYEDNMKASMALMDGGDTQGLYMAAKLHQVNADNQLRRSKRLLQFIELKGISAQELSDYLQSTAKILAEDDDFIEIKKYGEIE